jgi:hypothetical protein
MGGTTDVLQGPCDGTDLAVANREGDVPENEGDVISGATVFAGAQEVEKGQPGHVHDGSAELVGMESGKGLRMIEDTDRDRLDAVGSWVVAGKGPSEGPEAGVNLAGGVVPGVGEAHVGERLRDGAEGLLYLRRSYGPAAPTGAAVAVADGKDSEETSFVGDIAEEGVGDAMEGKERKPALCPHVGLGCATLGTNGVSGDFRCKAEITCESVPGLRGCICQGLACGKWRSK